MFGHHQGSEIHANAYLKSDLRKIRFIIQKIQIQMLHILTYVTQFIRFHTLQYFKHINELYYNVYNL